MPIMIAFSTIDWVLANATANNGIVTKLTLFTFINWKCWIRAVTFVIVRGWVEISSDIASLAVSLWAWLATWVFYFAWNTWIKWVQSCWWATHALCCWNMTCFACWWAIVALTVRLVFTISTATESCKSFCCTFVKIHLISISRHSCVFQLCSWRLVKNQFEFRTCFDVLFFIQNL